MTTMLLRDEVKYFIDLYKQNLALRAEIEQLKEEMN
jgi:PTS system lactose-specific IIA component